MDQEQQLSFLLERQLKMLMEISTKKYDKEIAELKSHMSHLQQDLETLRANVKSIRVEQAQAAHQPAPPAVHHEPPVEHKPEHISNQEIAQASNAGESVSMRMARTGNYQSEDVSVEKFFYFGNKK
jgi:multidrug resistance efflux pump